MLPTTPVPAPGRGEACPVGPDLWCRPRPDGSYEVGLSEEGVRRVGRIAHLRTPVVGRRYASGESALSIESEKWVGHLPLPVPGTVTETNEAAMVDPSVVVNDPYGAGWLYRMRPEQPSALAALLRDGGGSPA